MPLISCYECGKQISDKANACVGCGAPVAGQIECVDCEGSNISTAKICIHCGGPIISVGTTNQNKDKEDAFTNYTATDTNGLTSQSSYSGKGSLKFSDLADQVSPGYTLRAQERAIIDDKLNAPFTEKLRLYFSTIITFFVGYAALNFVLFSALRDEWGLDGYVLDEVLFPFAFWGSVVSAGILALGNYDYKLRYVSDASALVRIIIAAPAGFFISYLLGVSDFAYEFAIEVASNSSSVRNFDIRGAANELGGGLVIFANVIPLFLVSITNWILLLPLRSTGKE